MTITITPEEVNGYENAMNYWSARRITYMEEIFLNEGTTNELDFHYGSKNKKKLMEALNRWDTENPQPTAMTYFFPRK